MFRPHRIGPLPPVAQDTTVTPDQPVAETTETPEPSQPVTRPAPARTAPAPAPVPEQREPEKTPENAAAPPPEPDSPRPVLTVRLSAEQESALREKISADIQKANEALALVRGRTLTKQQADDMALVDDFLKNALAARSTDLVRAGTLAEKARLLAEELRAQVVR